MDSRDLTAYRARRNARREEDRSKRDKLSLLESYKLRFHRQATDRTLMDVVLCTEKEMTRERIKE